MWDLILVGRESAAHPAFCLVPKLRLGNFSQFILETSGVGGVLRTIRQVGRPPHPFFHEGIGTPPVSRVPV